MRRIVLVMCLAWLAGASWLHAAPPPASLTPPIAADDKTYELEVVVFEHNAPELVGEEQWPPFVDKVDSAVKDAAEPDNPKPGSRLESAAAALRTDQRYRLLAHKTWVQLAEAKKDAMAVRISGGDANELDGTVRFYVSRFLHLDIELALRGSEPAQSLKQEPTSTLAPTPATPTSGVALYKLSEARRVKSKEIHYFDHPKLGVLVYINPK